MLLKSAQIESEEISHLWAAGYLCAGIGAGSRPAWKLFSQATALWNWAVVPMPDASLAGRAHKVWLSRNTSVWCEVLAQGLLQLILVFRAHPPVLSVLWCPHLSVTRSWKHFYLPILHGQQLCSFPAKSCSVSERNLHNWVMIILLSVWLCLEYLMSIFHWQLTFWILNTQSYSNWVKSNSVLSCSQQRRMERKAVKALHILNK